MLKLTLELTTRCNNNCIHCFNNRPFNDHEIIKNEISTDRILEIVDQAYELGTLWIILTGGEVLLRKDFEKIYKYVIKKGFLVSILTNATLITNEHIKLFKKHPPRDIEITAYGASEKVYSRVTRTHNYSFFLAGIEKLQAASIPFTLKAVIMKANYKYFIEIAEFCKKRSKRKFRFDPFLTLRSDNNTVRNKDILNQRLPVDEIIKIEQSDSERMRELEKKCQQIDQKKTLNPTGKLFQCGAGVDSAFISSFGFFRICHSLVNKKYSYNLNSGELKEAWNNFTPGILSLTSDKKSYLKHCCSCKLINICMWCPAICDLEIGALDEKIDYFCSLTKKRYNSCSLKNLR